MEQVKVSGDSQAGVMTVKHGSALWLLCNADGNPEPSYSWLHNKSLVPAEVNRVYEREQVSFVDAGDYACSAANIVGVVNSANSMSVVVVAPQPNTSNTALIVGLVIAALVLIILIIVIIGVCAKRKHDSESPTSSAEIATNSHDNAGMNVWTTDISHSVSEQYESGQGEKTYTQPHTTYLRPQYEPSLEESYNYPGRIDGVLPQYAQESCDQLDRLHSVPRQYDSGYIDILPEDSYSQRAAPIDGAVDSDVIVILLAFMPQFLKIDPDFELHVDYNSGTNRKNIHVNVCYESLGEDVCLALPFFHCFTGADSTCFFYKLTKKMWFSQWNKCSTRDELTNEGRPQVLMS
ncbi:PREDICTED: uncharacterized protein LOC106812172 [Priapulus caudatus]|uniref:Uncharacterized protein LOC106812172 n=1 Tax=Priapulus caudatus TaxID=37621 RepID=A0ABM1EH06_PRICU|nr:PREDICTED: uncharacterized protein LOC106812172 [Priapulus caudatus]